MSFTKTHQEGKIVENKAIKHRGDVYLSAYEKYTVE